MPRLTVILPAHNAAPYIGVAVASTLRALPRDAQIVVYDDASTDGTGDIVRAMPDPRVHVADDSSPRGLVGALTYLLASTDSEIVARMDADDITLPWRFARQLTAVRRADVVFGAVVPFGSGRIPVPGAPYPLSGLGCRLALLIDNPMSHPSMVARREALEAVGGYRPGAAEDWELWLRLAGADRRLVRLGTPCVAMRFHDASVSAAQGYRERLSADAGLTASYGAFARRVLGPDCPGADEVSDARLFEDRLALLGPAIRARLRGLDPRARLVVEASLARSARLAKSQNGSPAPVPAGPHPAGTGGDRS